MTLKWTFRGVAAAAGLWLSFTLVPLIYVLYSGNTWPVDKLGQWGDSFGSLNALFATLGFGAALYTLLKQQEQFASSKFDSSFFELLKLFIEARDRVTFRHSINYIQDTRTYTPTRKQEDYELYKGVEAFQRIWSEIRYYHPLNKSDDTKEVVRFYDAHIHNENENTLGPYFRLLYTILYRIQSDRTISNEDKVVYGNLIRSQLSDHEASLAGLNALSRRSKDFRFYVRCFRLLKYTTGMRRKFFERHYEAYVFAERDIIPQNSFDLKSFPDGI